MAADENGTKQEEKSPEEWFKQLMAETEGLVPKGFVLEVEKDLAGSGKFAILRRLALTLLEHPFPQTMEDMKSSREFAVAGAHVAEVLNGAIESHEALVGWLRAAQLRLTFAVAAAREEDLEAVLAEAKADTNAARDELHHARFLRSLKPRK